MLWSVIAGARERVGEDLPSRVGTNAGWRQIESLDTEVVAAVDGTVEALVAESMTPKEVDAPDFKDWDRPRATLLMAEALAVHRSAGWYPVLAADYSDETRAYLEYAEGLSPETNKRRGSTPSGTLGTSRSVFSRGGCTRSSHDPRACPHR